MSNVDLDVAKKLGLTDIKKFWRHAGYVEIVLDWLYDWILAFAIFVRYLCRVYDNKDVTKNMNVKQNIDLEWMSSFFVQLYQSI